jgi:hypothetical protein
MIVAPALLGFVLAACCTFGLAAVLHYRTGPPIDLAVYVVLRVVVFAVFLVVSRFLPGTVPVGEYTWSSAQHWFIDRWEPALLHAVVLLPLTTLVLVLLARRPYRRRILQSLFFSEAGFGVLAVVAVGTAIFISAYALMEVGSWGSANGLGASLLSILVSLYLILIMLILFGLVLTWIVASVLTSCNASSTHPLLPPVGTAVVSIGMLATGVWQAATPALTAVQIGSTVAVVAACWLECTRIRASLGVSFARPLARREVNDDSDLPDHFGRGMVAIVEFCFDFRIRWSDKFRFVLGLLARPRWRWVPEPGPGPQGEAVGDVIGQAERALPRPRDPDSAHESPFAG